MDLHIEEKKVFEISSVKFRFLLVEREVGSTSVPGGSCACCFCEDA